MHHENEVVVECVKEVIKMSMWEKLEKYWWECGGVWVENNKISECLIEQCRW